MHIGDKPHTGNFNHTDHYANTFVLLDHMGNSISCIRISLGDTPWGLRQPLGVPWVDPSIHGRNILIPRLPQVLLQYHTPAQ